MIVNIFTVLKNFNFLRLKLLRNWELNESNDLNKDLFLINKNFLIEKIT